MSLYAGIQWFVTLWWLLHLIRYVNFMYKQVMPTRQYCFSTKHIFMKFPFASGYISLYKWQLALRVYEWNMLCAQVLTLAWRVMCQWKDIPTLDNRLRGGVNGTCMIVFPAVDVAVELCKTNVSVVSRCSDTVIELLTWISDLLITA